MNIRLKVRDYACPLCGSDEDCPDACPANEWPRRVTPRLLATRCLIGLSLTFALLSMVIGGQWGAVLALCGVLTFCGVCVLEAWRG
jgi:hypothetical protein